MIQKEKIFGVKNNGFWILSQGDQEALGTIFLGQNLGNGWSKSIVLENKVPLNFDFNQVIWATRSGVMTFF